MKSSLPVLLMVPLVLACTARTPVAPEQGRHPDWLSSLIRNLETQAVQNPPLSIARYEYKGQFVYYVPPRCCDVWGDLYQSDGAVLCHPDGGFTGRGDGRCPDFFADRKNELIVWRDPRS
jgi:Domain of unknown function (DUF6970)